MARRWHRRMAAAVAGVLGLALLGMGAPLVYLKLHETQLVFEAQRTHQWQGLPLSAPAGMRELRIGQLHGIAALPERQREPQFWVLHLHGNADSAFSPTQLGNMQRLTAQGLAVLAFDYRGFGPTPGTPSEQGMYQDAAAAWAWLRASGVPASHIIIWGHSLGSAPAVQLASEHAAGALVLFGAFTSIPDVAAERYPWLPVRWVASVRMNSLRRIRQIRAPVVIAQCVGDRVIPYAHAGRLFAAAPEPKRLLELQDCADDGLGGHVTGLYLQLDRLMPLLQQLAGLP